MQDLLFQEEPIENRAALLRDNCDQILERSYTRNFGQNEINQKRSELEQVSIEVADLEQELATIRAEYKGRIKPLVERRAKILDELKARGEWVQGECYKFVDYEEGRTAIYTPEGYKIEDRPITPEERQRNIIQASRFIGHTGTTD